jgi:hypothetical protein
LGHDSFLQILSNHYSPLITSFTVYNQGYQQHQKTDHKERKEDDQFQRELLYKTVDFQLRRSHQIQAVSIGRYEYMVLHVACSPLSYV